VIQFFDEWGKAVDRLATAKRIEVKGCEPYECSYSYSLSRLNTRFVDRVLFLSELLVDFPIGRRLNLLTGMLDWPLTRARLAKLFALLRAGIVRLTGEAKSALNAPVFAARRDDGFPLHADLFLTERLFLIFDDVPLGPSGTSLFLSVEEMLDIVARVSEMPREIAARLRRLLHDAATRDSFDEFYNLLYSADNPWRDEIVRKFDIARSRIKLDRGEGYLIDDRRWLHGRTAIHGAVSRARFRRLVFGLISQA
jgi:hypothetical protein